MVDMSAIGAVATSLNTAVNIAKAMMDVRDATIIQGKVFELQRAIIDAQQSVFAANQERSTLVERVGELERLVAEMKAWEAEKQRYILQKLPPGVFVYALKLDMANGEPPHYLCQTCYQRGKKSILQSKGDHWGVEPLMCNECGAEVKVALLSKQ